MTALAPLKELLAGGRCADILAELQSAAPAKRRTMCKPLVVQAKAILSAPHSSTVGSWLGDLRQDDPGGQEQLVGAWAGRLTSSHRDAATLVLLGSKQAAQAAKVWPIPEEESLARLAYPTLFPEDLEVVVEQWSTDFLTNPKNWDRNRNRTIMFEWIEAELTPVPRHPGAVLMLACGGELSPGREMLAWLISRPTIARKLFPRIFTTPGIRGASLAQTDESNGGHPLRTVVVPGLIAAGVWAPDDVATWTTTALASDLPTYQRRWYLRLAADLAQ